MTARNLPYQSTPFVGRTEEIAELSTLLNDPACRLLTLMGMGGIGKTRLATEVAAHRMDRFPDGVFFVPLQPLTSSRDIVSAIAASANCQIYGQLSPQQQLLSYLGAKQMLLLLDNFEHLLDGADLLSEILAAAPDVKILITSRLRLHLQEEWVFDLHGLAFPESEEVGSLRDYHAVQLFWHHAHRASSRFSPTQQDWIAMARICRLVEGMPLGIELAAAWVRALPCQAIVDQIEHGLDILTTAVRNVPEKHRSMQTVFNWSWRLLSEEGRTGFTRLSVFRGGFPREAAEAVAGVSLGTLAALVDQSLLWVDADGRYDMHELLRQYAEDQLNHSGQASAVRDAHCTYYAAFLDRLAADLKGPNQIEALAAMEAELDNIRAGWRWAVAQGKETEILQSLDSLALFYQMRGRFQEAEEAFALAVRRFEPVDSAVLAETLGLQAWFAHGRGDQRRGRELMINSWSILRRLGLHRRVRLLYGTPLLALYVYNQDLGGYQEAVQLYHDQLKLFQQRGDLSGVARVLIGLGRDAFALGKEHEAQQLLYESLAAFRAIGDRWGSTYSLNTLAGWAMQRGAYDEAFRLFEESFVINKEVGDHGGVAWARSYLSVIAYRLREYNRARQYIIETLEARLRLGTFGWADDFEMVSAQLLEAEGHIELAVELLAFSYIHSEFLLLPHLKDEIIQHLDRLKARLAPEVFTAAVQRGETADLESISTTLLAVLSTPGGDPDPTAPLTDPRLPSTDQPLIEPLRQRELEVLQLIADGLSTRETAQKLFLSVGTIRWYLKQIYGKLQVHNRTQAIARARELKLLT